MRYFVALDSGGTKTECWLGDEARVLATASCGTCKLTRVGQEIATERMRGLLLEVSVKAGVPLSAISRTCVGVAGYSILEVREWAELLVRETVAGEVEVCGDDEIALDAAFQGEPGILVIGGTGSIVIGRAADGARFTCGGWGPAIGDEGSGFWIGREAVRLALRAHDRGSCTTLLDAVRKSWGVADVGGLVALANARPGPDFAALVPVVVACAQAGDPLARQVLLHAGAELADQVNVVWRKLQGHGMNATTVAYTGSVLEKIPAVRQAMQDALPAELDVREQAVNSMEGAMWRARRQG